MAMFMDQGPVSRKSQQLTGPDKYIFMFVSPITQWLQAQYLVNIFTEL